MCKSWINTPMNNVDVIDLVDWQSSSHTLTGVSGPPYSYGRLPKLERGPESTLPPFIVSRRAPSGANGCSPTSDRLYERYDLTCFYWDCLTLLFPPALSILRRILMHWYQEGDFTIYLTMIYWSRLQPSERITYSFLGNQIFTPFHSHGDGLGG